MFSEIWITATHTITGVASVPLLFAKLWAVYPMLWSRPLFRDIPHALERLSLLPLVGGSLLLLSGGTSNHLYWYPNPRFFTPTHYWLAWITVGALLVHIGAKIGVTRNAMRRGRSEQETGFELPAQSETKGGLGQ